RIASVQLARALELRGVVDAFDLSAFGPDPPTFPVIVGHESLKACPQYPLGRDRVRYVGEAVAVVLAETRAVADDALELVEVSLDPLPPVASIDAALRSDAPVLHAD